MNTFNKHQDATEIADAYNDFGLAYHQSRTKRGWLFNEFIDVPTTLSLIPTNLTNLAVLDAGCGSGLYACEIAKRGAKVTGIDISETMILIAKQEKPENLDIDYHIGDLYNIPLNDGSIDLIICNYVLENIKNIDLVLAEFKRVLKPGGECIYSISHPIRAMAKRKKLNNSEIWQLENYFDRGIRISDFGEGMKVKKYKRTLADYINASINAGFIIKRLLEPQPIPEGKTHDSDAYATATRLPQLLTINMRKPENLKLEG